MHKNEFLWKNNRVNTTTTTNNMIKTLDMKKLTKLPKNSLQEVPVVCSHKSNGFNIHMICVAVAGNNQHPKSTMLLR